MRHIKLKITNILYFLGSITFGVICGVSHSVTQFHVCFLLLWKIQSGIACCVWCEYCSVSFNRLMSLILMFHCFKHS